MPQRAKSNWLSDRIGAGAAAAAPRRLAGGGGAPSPDVGAPWLHCPAPRVRVVGGGRTAPGAGGRLRLAPVD